VKEQVQQNGHAVPQDRKYDVVGVIGRGAWVSSYKATTHTWTRKVAIKYDGGFWPKNPESSRRFFREAQSLGSPCTPQTRDCLRFR